MGNWQNLKDELLTDPEVKEEYDRLAPEYELTKQLIQARRSKHLSQEELANLSGIKQSHISRLEGGNHNCTIKTLERIVSALGGSLEIKLKKI